MSTPLSQLPATTLRQLIAHREVSASAVLADCLGQLQRHNPTINAVVTLNPDVEEDARSLDDRLARGADPGPLCGLPVGIKDVTPVAGLRTTYGSPIYAQHVPDDDALVVRRLRQAGALIMGKTNCPEFAAGGNTFNDVFGRTRNPWNTERSAGGSTGGGAAALATGMIALAEGTDLGGSLRIPASFCGVVGLRPSVGLVPTHPTDWVWDTLQVTGPMARTAEDVALMLQAISGPSDLSPFAQPEGRDFVRAVQAGAPKGSRIAYCADPAGIGVDSQIEGACRDTTFALRSVGFSVDEIDFDLSSARPAFLALRGLWFVTQMSPRLDQQARFGTNVANNVRSGLDTTTHALALAEQERGRMWHRFRDLFTRFDYFVTPCMAVAPFPVEQNYPDAVAGRKMANYVDWIAPTFVLSLSSLPIAAVPAGLDQHGLPVGLQLVGRPRADETVLALAHNIQQLRPLPKMPF